MSVSLYYYASRGTPLTAAETAEVQRIATAREETFPYDDTEGLCLYDGGGSTPEEILAGSTKMPGDGDVERMMSVLGHVLETVSALRRVLPDAEWRVHLDDMDMPWDEEQGYLLPT